MLDAHGQRRGEVLGPISDDLLTSRSGGQKAHRSRERRGLSESRRQPAAGYFAAFFLRAAQEAFIRSDTASFSLAVIGRRFLVGVASDAVSATGVAAAAVRREEERRAAGFAGAEVPRILSTSFNALISACSPNLSGWFGVRVRLGLSACSSTAGRLLSFVLKEGLFGGLALLISSVMIRCFGVSRCGALRGLGGDDGERSKTCVAGGLAGNGGPAPRRGK